MPFFFFQELAQISGNCISLLIEMLKTENCCKALKLLMQLVTHDILKNEDWGHQMRCFTRTLKMTFGRTPLLSTLKRTLKRNPITEYLKENPITEGLYRTLSLRTLRGTLSLTIQKRTLSLRTLKGSKETLTPSCML